MCGRGDDDIFGCSVADDVVRLRGGAISHGHIGIQCITAGQGEVRLELYALRRIGKRFLETGRSFS